MVLLNLSCSYTPNILNLAMHIKGLVAIIGFLLEVYILSVFVTEILKLIQDSQDKSFLVVVLALGGLIAIPVFLLSVFTERK